MSSQLPPSAALPRIDIHVHLAGVGTQRSGCWISPHFRRRPSFLGLRLLAGITARQMNSTIDQDWAALLSSLARQSELDYLVVLGFDGAYDDQGRLDRERSQMIVPCEWVFEVAERFGNLLPAPSINPYRRDALDILDRAIERGAVMIKWLPIAQGFDPASPRSHAFLKRLADCGIPLLAHAGGGEVTFKTIAPGVGSLRHLLPALELGVRVICAHAAAPVQYTREQNEMPLLRDLLARFPNLWVDNSGLTNPSRFRHLPECAEDPLIRNRTLHGSDFPVISDAFYYPRRIPMRRLIEIERERNPLQRDLLIKKEIGFDETTLYRATDVLANLHRWINDAGTRPPVRMGAAR